VPDDTVPLLRSSPRRCRAQQVGSLLATHAALAIAESVSLDRARNLERALESNREIAVAIGVLMTTHRITRADAFNLLRIASQRSNREMSDIDRLARDRRVPQGWGLYVAAGRG
jgi:hypothetical protein